MTIFVMFILSFVKKVSQILKDGRSKGQLLTREVAASLGIDAALVSRFESGERMPTKTQIIKLAEILNLSIEEIMVPWMAQKIIDEVGTDTLVLQALTLAEEQVKYNLKAQIELDQPIQNKIAAIDKLKLQLSTLRQNDNFRLADALAVEYTFESNKIEGNTLSLQETALVVQEGLTISGKSMREHLEAINHFEAISFIKDLVAHKTLFTEKILLQIHSLILRGIDRDNAGIYRKVQVRISGSKHEPPEPWQVPIKMEILCDWYQSNILSLHPVVLAAEMHERLVSIHPFIDGNGRTSRLLMNLILLQNGYTISNLRGDTNSRQRYYNALENARQDTNKFDFIDLILDSELASLTNNISQLTI
jgi:Fic family protein